MGILAPWRMALAGLAAAVAGYFVVRRRARARLLANSVTAALQRREEQARKMALVASHTENALVVTGADGCIEWVNAGFTVMTGYSAAQALGKRFIDVLLGPEAEQATLAQMREQLVRGSGVKVQLDACKKSGQGYCVALEVQPIGDEGEGFVAVASDITLRVRAEQELRRAHDELQARITDGAGALARAQRAEEALRLSEQKTRLILEAALDAVVTADAVGTITGWNGQAEQTFGWTEPEAIGRPLHELIIPVEFREAYLRGLARVREAGAAGVMNRRIELRALHRHGHTFPVELAIASMWVGDACIFSAFARNISERKRTEEQLDEAKQTAEAASRAKSELLASVSHQIRTPMTAITGYADLMLDADQSASDRINCVDTIRRNAEHLLTVINDIVDISRIEAGEMTLERTACSPSDVVSDVASLLRPRAVEKGLTFDVHIEPPIPEVVLTDPARLRQILINLAGNALKFTESGGVRLVMKLVSAADGHPRLRFELTDTSAGLGAEPLTGPLAPFMQAGASTTRRYDGIDLGLTLCKRLAEMLGGDLTLDSVPGRGSSFAVTIDTGPLEGARLLSGFGESVTAATSPRRLPRPLTGTVLLAEDSPDNQRLLSFYLRKAGAHVTVAENGKVAYEKALAAAEAGTAFDLILMDMQMPELDGYSAASKLRANGYTGPIVALTAHAMADDRARCLSAGCTDYLSKPVDRGRLLETVWQYLSSHGPAEPEPNGNADGSATGTSAASGADTSAATMSSVSDLSPIRSSLAADPDMGAFLTEYVKQLPTMVRGIMHLLDGQDLEQLGDAVHQLKGTGGLYGFDDITESATAAERGIKGGEPLAAVRRDVESLLRLIRRVEGYSPAAEKTTGDGAAAS